MWQWREGHLLSLICPEWLLSHSALVWGVMGTTCLGSIMFLYITRERPISVLYYGRIWNESVVGSLSKRVRRSKHDADVPPPSCAKADSVWRLSDLASWDGIQAEGQLIWSLNFYIPLGILHKWVQWLLNCHETLWTKSALDLFTGHTNPQKCFTKYRIFSILLAPHVKFTWPNMLVQYLWQASQFFVKLVMLEFSKKGMRNICYKTCDTTHCKHLHNFTIFPSFCVSSCSQLTV